MKFKTKKFKVICFVISIAMLLSISIFAISAFASEEEACSHPYGTYWKVIGTHETQGLAGACRATQYLSCHTCNGQLSATEKRTFIPCPGGSGHQ